jgi:hypothetical protein
MIAEPPIHSITPQRIQEVIDQLVYQNQEYRPTQSKCMPRNYDERFVKDCFTLRVGMYNQRKKTLTLYKFHPKYDEYTKKHCQLSGKEICSMLRRLLNELKIKLNQIGIIVDTLIFEIFDYSKISFKDLKNYKKYNFSLFHLLALKEQSTFYMKYLNVVPSHRTKQEFEELFRELGQINIKDVLSSYFLTHFSKSIRHSRRQLDESMYEKIKSLRYLVLKTDGRCTTFQEIMEYIYNTLKNYPIFKKRLKELIGDDDPLHFSIQENDILENLQQKRILTTQQMLELDRLKKKLKFNRLLKHFKLGLDSNSFKFKSITILSNLDEFLDILLNPILLSEKLIFKPLIYNFYDLKHILPSNQQPSIQQPSIQQSSIEQSSKKQALSKQQTLQNLIRSIDLSLDIRSVEEIIETLEDERDRHFLNEHLELFKSYYDLIGLEALFRITEIISDITDQIISKKIKLFNDINEFKLIL